jgi:NAD(P)-dependent dehydrogenase (short-subunit alcohol dehydrogenase family)
MSDPDRTEKTTAAFDAANMLASTDRPVSGKRLQGRVAIVSGAGCGGDLIGVGAATALLFAAQGAKVGILDRDRNRAAQTLHLIERIGAQGTVLEADIRHADSCRKAVAEAVSAFGRLDTVVNSAAIVRPGHIGTVTEPDWQDVLDICLTGAQRLTQAATPHLVERGGAIVNISSVAGSRGFGSAAYAAAKAGLEGLTRDTAVALGRQRVRCNCIVAGFIWAPMAGGGPSAREARRLASPLGTEGTAWDIGFAALFMVSDEARWITGTCLPVDAGLTITGPLRFS